MKRIFNILLIAGTCTALQACALFPKTLKAPCGPTAGLTDPCGNRVPLNREFRPGLDGYGTGENGKVYIPRQPEEVQV